MFVITIVWGAALDAYSHFIAEALAMSILVLNHIFYVPQFAPGPLLLKLSGLNSIESEEATKKLLFSGRLITESKMTPLIKNLFDNRTKSFFDSDISSLRVLPSIAESLKIFDLLDYFETWYNNSIFPTYPYWKNIVRDSIIHFLKSQPGVTPTLKCTLLALVLQM